jgi:hypothetical protein
LGLAVGGIALKSKILGYVFNFYYIGSLIIGGGHVVVPLMLTVFSQKFGISEDSFWNGTLFFEFKLLKFHEIIYYLLLFFYFIYFIF